MESTGTAGTRKHPWELHAIACLLALTIGYGISQRPYLEEYHYLMLAGLPVCLFGLFRGSPVAWVATLLAFSGLALMGLFVSAELLLKYGLRLHPTLMKAHALTLVCATVTALLASCRARGAFPTRARPLMEELVLFTRVTAVAAPVLFVLAALFSLSLILLFEARRTLGNNPAYGTLKTLTSAEADFRANDRDCNQINDFWVGDVAGLYCVIPKQPPNAPMIKLIELTMAAADANPLAGQYPPIPAVQGHNKRGMWFQALSTDRSTVPPTPYWTAGQPTNTSRFGFISYPDDYIDGSKYAFIVNENNTLFRRPLTGDIKPSDKVPPGPLKISGFTDWPSDDELKAYWSKLD